MTLLSVSAGGHVLALLLAIVGLPLSTLSTRPVEAVEAVEQSPFPTSPPETTISLWHPALRSGNISSPSLTPGSQLTVYVNITNAPLFDYYSFAIEYHPLALSFLGSSVEGTVFWPDISTNSTEDSVPGGVISSAVSGTRTALGSGILLIARFMVQQLGLSILLLTNTEISCVSCGVYSVPHTVSSGCFNNRTPDFQPADFSSGPAPNYFETSEYMIGKIAVGIILPESTGSTYDWTAGEVSQSINGVKAGMNWWSSQEANAMMSFVYDEHVQVPTSYEPIDVYWTDSYLWVQNVMNQLGYAGDAWTATTAYNNAIRTASGADWAFTVFVVDSTPIPSGQDGRFPGGQYAFAYLGGPWETMSRFSTFPALGSNYYWAVPAHETGHIFRATDEYNFITETEGYLWVPDSDGSFGIMNQLIDDLSVGTRAQMGLVDCDADGIMDLLDTQPALQLNSPPTTIRNPMTTVNGQALVVPYPTFRPGARDITVGKISQVTFWIDTGTPLVATATDGAFDEALESFQFVLTGLTPGLHTVYVRAVNSVNISRTISFTVSVTISGDVNVDCTVNILDLVLAGLAFGSMPVSSNWNPDADLNGDGQVNIIDLVTIGTNFGQSCT